MKPRLVLLHGFTGSPASWDAVVASLGRRVEVLAPTLWGHDPELDYTLRPEPEVDFDDPYDPRLLELTPQTIEEEAARLLGTIAAQMELPAHIAGYSLGARVALTLLTLDPEAFTSATLIGVNPGLQTDEERAARRRDDERWIALLDEGIEAFVDQWEQLPLWATQARLSADVLAKQRADRLRHDPRGLQRSLRIAGLAEQPDLRPLLPELRLPVTLMAGGEDPKFVTLARETAAVLPDARVVVVPDAGHNLLLERPEAVVQELNLRIR